METESVPAGETMDTFSDNGITNGTTTTVIEYTPNEKSMDISKLGDKGKLYKEIITPGEGDETPGENMEVSVHYTGKLPDGTVFDSSVKRGTPFVFTLGQGKNHLDELIIT